MRCNNCGSDHFFPAEYVMPAAGLRLVVPRCADCGVFAIGTSQLQFGEEAADSTPCGDAGAPVAPTQPDRA